ncbi:MAG: hypothetical protein ACK5IM_07530 [Demequina sp.]|uniref:hypothetical protein n=1 Tax=Demequina sp. TaxID=2050685 RepID=UPI003A8522CB
MAGTDDVDLDDLLTDEAKWRAIADVAEGAYTTATALSPLPFMVTDGLSYAQGFKTQYDELASAAATYIADGVTAMRDIADRLHDTHDEYSASESDATDESVEAEWV